MSRYTWFFLAVAVVLVLSLLILLPMDKGTLLGRPIKLGLDLQGGTRIVYKADLSSIPDSQKAKALDGAIAVLQNRINPLGVSEPNIRKLGADQILVEVPGKTLTDTEKDNLARVALLEFGEQVTDNETYKWQDVFGKWKPATGVVDNQTLELTSAYFQDNTYVTTGNLGQVLLIFNWDVTGSQLSEQITTRLYNASNAPLGIFEGDQPLLGEDGRPIAPSVQGIISDRGQIEGLSPTEASRLSSQLNAGRLPIPLSRTSDERTVEPWLGAGFVTKSVRAGALAIAMTMLFLIVYYRISGLMASFALAYYAILTLAIFKVLTVTLSLSAIGGFILSVGMAIDANVLIFERMKEEMWAGRTVGAAIETGFSRAWTAIWDSHVTTLLSGLIIYWLGSSSFVASDIAKGFAVTLMIGVAVSLFSAITVTRTFLRPFVNTTFAANPSFFAPWQRKTNV
jgi:preprotein translocase subunit SecD